ncbi:AAA domain-containing protein [Tenacibaculum halocynthiae]|uniref:AAA domain-containing protein n=1 Tax=Tenacibaculum halocynthiae TaxID=1254437 RepID=UPI0038957709
MMHIEKVISYYQNCYKQEFRENDVLSFFGSAVDKRLFFQNINHLFREEESTLLDFDLGEELYRYLEIHKKNKTLITNSFFITGKLNFLGKKRTICAPLIVTPVELKINSDGVYFFDYKFEENRLNEALVNVLKQNFSIDEAFILMLKSLVTKHSLDKKNSIDLANKLKEIIPINTDELNKLPVLTTDVSLKKAQKVASLEIHNSVALGIVDKTKSSRDVLFEIDRIKEGHLYNDALEALFSRNRNSVYDVPKKNKKETIYVPSNLSVAQKEIVHEVKSGSPFTVVVGPPGTGKSYTIASLAIDMVYNNKSVLICAKSDQAVDVVNEKIVNDLGIKGLTVRIGKGRGYNSRLRKKLESILNFSTRQNINEKTISFYEKELVVVEEKIKEIEEEITRREIKEIENAQLFLDYNPSFFKRIKKTYVSKKILKEVPFWQLVELLNNYIQKKNSTIKKIVTYSMSYKNQQSINYNRQMFKDLLQLTKSTDPEVKEQLFESISFKYLLECLPIWISKSTDISNTLPLENDIFDVVIIDEASQSDIATMIPVIARAKKVVVVGDPKQLKHVSFLSSSSMENVALDLGLVHDIDVFNYRKNSFLDYVIQRVNTQANIHFLDEHYRSVPSIIDYSNDKFYDGKLKVMSDIKIHQTKTAVHWHYVKGIKDKKGFNIEEASQLLKDIEIIIEEERELQSAICTSIGILSPFRDQVNYLKKKLEEFDISTIKKHKISVGTPFDFQGEERDVMFISFAIDDNTSNMVFQYLNREDVFNVSITRAKSKQNLYYSFSPKSFSNTNLLIDYYSRSNQNVSTRNEDFFIDDFAEEVFKELMHIGISKKEVLFHHAVAGYFFDIVLPYNNKTVCVDLIGYPGEMEKSFSIEQYKTLFRIRTQIITIPYAYWLLNKKACVDYILKKLGNGYRKKHIGSN